MLSFCSLKEKAEAGKAQHTLDACIFEAGRGAILGTTFNIRKIIIIIIISSYMIHEPNDDVSNARFAVARKQCIACDIKGETTGNSLAHDCSAMNS